MHELKSSETESKYIVGVYDIPIIWQHNKTETLRNYKCDKRDNFSIFKILVLIFAQNSKGGIFFFGGFN